MSPARHADLVPSSRVLHQLIDALQARLTCGRNNLYTAMCVRMVQVRAVTLGIAARVRATPRSKVLSVYGKGVAHGRFLGWRISFAQG